MRPTRLLLLLAIAPWALAVPSCQAPHHDCTATGHTPRSGDEFDAAEAHTDQDDGPEEWSEQDGDDAEDLRRELDRARRRLEIVRLDAQSSVADAEFALEAARADLRDWEGFTAPEELDEARRELQALHDALQDAADELAQLRLMYEGDDLAEATASLVLDRARRDVERRREEVAAAERTLAHLERVEHPRRRAELEHAVRLAELAAAAAREQAELDLAEAEEEVASLEEELADLEVEGDD